MPSTTRFRFGSRLIGLATAACAGLVGIGPAHADATSEPTSAAAKAALIPPVTPTPQQITPGGAAAFLPKTIELVVDASTDTAARALLRSTLLSHGVRTIKVRSTPSRTGDLIISLGSVKRADIRTALGATRIPTKAEGYALKAQGYSPAPDRIVLGGVDGAGQYYAVQTLRQLLVKRLTGNYAVPGVAISDWPSMPLRGTIEGFYGNPWTQEERLDQLKFYGDVKANTYIYAPKDDPYHRELWREPYPADKLAQLAELATQATAEHVRFTFALSPGNTVCYSADADFQAIVTKFQQMYDAGVRAFSVPLDDINLSSWHCDADRQMFGNPSGGTAGAAQVYLLNRLQREFVETHPGTTSLQMVPTEYSDTRDSAYKQAIRTLDEDVVVMWTGVDVVPPSVTIPQAQAAAAAYGTKPFLWDNYPVNDYNQTAGRLLLAPYDKREAGLSNYLSGIVSNPMNQAAASKIAIFGVADFSWNDRAYNAVRNWTEAMQYLSGGNDAATNALTVFGDLNHLAPSFGTPWQVQSPELASRIDDFWSRWEAGDKAEAVADLRTYAAAIAAAPARIRAGKVDPMFVSDAKPWLDATALWGQALVEILDAFSARLADDVPGSDAHRATSKEASTAAAAVLVDPPENTWGKAPVKIADGVLDTFLVKADQTLELWDIGEAVNVAPTGTATASSVEGNLPQFVAKNVNDDNPSTRWSSGYTDTEWIQVELPNPVVVRSVSVNWEAACATAYDIQFSTDGSTWQTVKHAEPTQCGLDTFTFSAGDPVKFVRMQGRDRVGNWGFSIYELGIYVAKDKA